VGYRTHVSVYKRLRVAASHCDDRGRDRHQLTIGQLPSPLTIFADVERHLVTRATIVRGTAEYLPSHEEKSCVVVEMLACFAPKLGDRLAKGCQRFARNFEAQHVVLERELFGRIRQRSQTAARNELFYLPRSATARAFEPDLLGLSRCDAR
jgi:hypothetical protein